MTLYETRLDTLAARGGNASVRDYLALMKPRVMSLVVFTAFVGLVLAPEPMHPVLAATAILCIAVGAGAAGALNMWYDADIDAVMKRTAGRPIPQGRISSGEALAFGSVMAAGSVFVLGVLVNWVAAAWLAFTIAFYVGIYTMWLKRRTPQNIVIGGAAGAFPPVVAWASATGGVSIEPLVLFLIIFLWTPPHFWALALLKSEDYRRAGVPMLPVVSGEASTRRQILLYSLILAPTAVLPALMGFASMVYGFGAAILGTVFVALAIQVWWGGASAKRAAGRLFGFSILYLFLVFAFLLV